MQIDRIRYFDVNRRRGGLIGIGEVALAGKRSRYVTGQFFFISSRTILQTFAILKTLDLRIRQCPLGEPPALPRPAIGKGKGITEGD